MPRVVGVKERRDKIWFDTATVEPGQEVHFFGGYGKKAKIHKRLLEPFKTNMQVAGQLGSDSTYVLCAIGARLIGKTRQEEELLLDHLLIKPTIGDHPYGDILGPHASMLRNVYSEAELAAYEKLADEPLELIKTQGEEWVPVEDDRPQLFLPRNRMPGYFFLRPIVIPVRQSFMVKVLAAQILPEAINMRLHLFGLQTREVP